MKYAVFIFALLAAPQAFARDCDSVRIKTAKLMDYMDTDKDGAISAEEHEMGWRKRFTDADANGDKFLSRKEVLDAKTREAKE